MKEQKKESVKRFGVPAIAVMAATMAAAPSAWAAPVTLAQYSFNDGTHDGSTAAAGDANDAAAITGLGVSDIAASTTSGFFSYATNAASTLYTTGSDDNETWYTTAGNSPATTGETGDYLEFTLTPTAGYTLTLGELAAHLGVSKNSNAPSGSNPWSFVVYTSLDGFATPLGGPLSSYAGSLGASKTTGGPFWTTPSVDLSSLGTLTGPITIRLDFSKDSTTTSADKYMLADTVSLTGNVNAVAVPEPAAASMGLLALGALATMRRRRA